MKLLNKKTGEIGKLHCDMNASPAKYGVFEDTDIRGHYWEYDSLAELSAEWTDYKEPKEHWAIDQFGEPINVSGLSRLQLKKLHRLGNDFPSENATIKAIEKLKAFKRLENKGFFFDGRTPVHDNTVRIRARVGVPFLTDELSNDLDLLFGGEE